jgi:hypothetical protein
MNTASWEFLENQGLFDLIGVVPNLLQNRSVNKNNFVYGLLMEF